jgi:DNA-binding MarR family transcriptional regulator
MALWPKKSDKGASVDTNEAFEGMLIAAHRAAVALGEIGVFQQGDLSVAEWALLKQLDGRQDVPLRQITAAAGVSRQRFRRLVLELETKGFVTTGRAVGNDRRARTVSATPMAAEVLSLVSEQMQDLIVETDKPRDGRQFVTAGRALDRTVKSIRRRWVRKPRRRDASRADQ